MPEVYKVSVSESFNNQSEMKFGGYLSECRNFASETFQSVTQRKGL